MQSKTLTFFLFYVSFGLIMQQNKQTNYLTGETKRKQISDLINGESGSNDDVLSKIESYVHKKV